MVYKKIFSDFYVIIEKINYFGWKMRQNIQYYLGDIFMCINRKNQYTWKDYFFWRTRKKYKRFFRKNVYIIRRRSGRKKLEGTTTMGICGILLFNLADIKYADEKGWIPFVDMCTYANSYLEQKDVGKYNAWDFFFEQENSVEDIKKDNYILSAGILKKDILGYEQLMDKEYHELELESWKKLVRKYVHVNKKILEKVQVFLEDKHFNQKKVLGVLCRGTDYNNLNPDNHPIQPSISQVIQKIHEFLNDNFYDYIYLATEDTTYFKEINKEFAGKVISYVEPSVRYQDGYFLDNIKATTQEKRRSGEEYLVSVLILSRCNAFIGGITSGTICTLLFEEKMERIFYFQLGFY